MSGSGAIYNPMDAVWDKHTREVDDVLRAEIARLQAQLTQAEAVVRAAEEYRLAQDERLFDAIAHPEKVEENKVRLQRLSILRQKLDVALAAVLERA